MFASIVNISKQVEKSCHNLDEDIWVRGVLYFHTLRAWVAVHLMDRIDRILDLFWQIKIDRADIRFQLRHRRCADDVCAQKWP